MTDVCVVGGGPAGLAAAIAVRRQGAEVTVLDCGVPAIDKACGEGLLPDSVVALRELGIVLPTAVGFGVRGIRFRDPQRSVTADFSNGCGIVNKIRCSTPSRYSATTVAPSGLRV